MTRPVPWGADAFPERARTPGAPPRNADVALASRVGIPALRAAWGALLLGRPDRLAALTAAPTGQTPRRILRLLGARHLCQAALTVTRPTPGVLAAGGVTDALHAASCLGVAVLDPRWRRAALIGGAGAALFAVADFTAAYRAVASGWATTWL